MLQQSNHTGARNREWSCEAFRPWLSPVILPQRPTAAFAGGGFAPSMPRMRLGTAAPSNGVRKGAKVSYLRQQERSRANYSSRFPARVSDSRPSGFRGLHHRFLHAVFSCPVQTDLVAIGIIEIGMAPTPGHHPWQLGHVEALFLEIAAEVIERTDFKIQTYTVAQYGIFRTHLMQSNGAVATGCAQPRIHGPFLILEIFYEFEAQQISVEDKPAFDVLNVDHGMIQSKLAFIV